MNLPATLRRGLHVTVLRSTTKDFTLGGFSARHAELTIVARLTVTGARYVLDPLPPLARVRAATPERPAAFLVRRNIGGHTLLHVAPAVAEPEMVACFKHGGNAAAPSDGRLNELLPASFYGCLNIHDRNESRDITVYADHPGGGGDGGEWCPWSGTLVVDRLPGRQCPAGHAAETVSQDNTAAGA
jgi:hypothetical protein